MTCSPGGGSNLIKVILEHSFSRIRLPNGGMPGMRPGER